MSRTTSYDTEAGDLVARTLAAVVAAGGDTHEREREPAPGDGRVVRLDVPPSSAGRPRRRHVGAAIGLAAAAVAVAGVLVSDGAPSDVTTGPVEAGEPSAIPSWLPPGVDDHGELLPATGDTGLAVEAAVLDTPGGGQVLVGEVSHEDGRPVERYEARWMLGRLAGLFGESDDEAVVRSDAEPRAIVAIPRGDVSAADVDLAVIHLASTSPFGASGPPAEDWTLRTVPVGWGPGLAPTVGRTFSGDDGMTSVEVSLVAGDLPGEADLGGVLGPIDPQAIGAVAGWRRQLQGSDQEMLLWQEAPGVVGIVVAAGVAPEDVVRVARSVDADRPPVGDVDGDDGVRIVAESNEGSDVEYRVEWSDRLPGEADGPCVTLVVGDEPSGPTCGIRQPDSTVLSFGPVTMVHGSDVYWGIVGPSVSTVELDRPGGGEPVVAEALPLDSGDPASMRYVVSVAPHSDVGTTTARFLDPDGRELDTETVEFVGDLGG